MLDAWKRRARALRTETKALYLASRDPRVPRRVRVLALGIVAYALSPIDLIPDFVPILGYLDDLVVLPLGICLLIRLIPHDVMDECRERAASEPLSFESAGKRAAVVMVLVWAAVATLVTVLVLWRLQAL
jgi:uncharacterized membrane protein YkvA (DUF1232 family)